MAASAGGGILYVAQSSANSVAVIDTGSNSVVATIPVGTTPMAVTVAPNGQNAYVVNVGSSSVSVIGTATNTVLSTVPIAGYPTAIAVTPNSSYAFVVSPTSGKVSVIDTASNTVTAAWPTLPGASSLAFSADSATVYIASRVTNQVAVYNVTTGSLLQTIGGLSYPDAIVLAPGGSTLYVLNLNASSVSVISTTTLAVVAAVKVNTNPTAIGVSPDGTALYVVNMYANSMSVISTALSSIVSTVTNLASPYSVAAPPAANPAPNLCAAAPTGLPQLPGVPGVSLPLLPQTCYQPPYPTTTSTVTVTANSGSDLQSKLSAAVCGEQIVVPANATYIGSFVYGPTNAIPFGWQANTAFTAGQQFVDPAYHLQLITIAGTSGSIEPEWNDSGGSTTDGGITWADQGLLPQYCPSNPVLVVSSNIANLPQYQAIPQSETPANVPTLECNTNGCATLSISDGVSGIYFAGIEFTLGPSAANVYPIVGMGGYTPAPYAVPSYVTFDRVLIHPAPCSATVGGCAFVQAGLDLNATYATLEYSNIWGIINTGQDTNAVSTNNNTGPILIAANYLEASGENVYFCQQCGNAISASGTVTTSGTTVTWNSGSPFNTSTTNAWPGALITINSVQYAIQEVTSSTSLTLTTSAGTQSSAVPFSILFYGYQWPWGQPNCPAPADVTVRLNHIKKQAIWRNNPVGYSGVVSTNGTTVSLISGTPFNPIWGNGGIYIVINGTNYIVTSPTTATSMTLTASAGTQTNVPYYQGCIPSIPWGCWDVKNGFEIKQGQRVLLDSNFFDTTFSEGQAGFFIWNCGINPTPTQICNDITVQNNLFEHGPSVGSPFGWSGYGPQNTNTSRGLIRNNIAIDISGPAWGADGYTGSVQNTKYQTFDHNTYLNTPTYATNPFSFMFADSPPHSNTGFTWTNSFQYGQPFADSDNAGMTLADWPNNGVPVTLGGIVNVGDTYQYVGSSPAYPAGVTSLSSPDSGCQTGGKVISTCWPLDWGLVGFVDFAGGSAGTNVAGLTLASGSPYQKAGTDGMDIGANVAAVVAAIAAIAW
jgi:YVTN family beta-propeller protein